MSKTRKRFFFIIASFIIITGLLIYRYERLLTETRAEMRFDPVAGGTKIAQQYQANEIIALIHRSKEYLKDSITIFTDGTMKSSNDKFQGTIEAVIRSKDNMDIVKANMAGNKLPVQYNIYILAAAYYRQQYASEFEPAK